MRPVSPRLQSLVDAAEAESVAAAVAAAAARAATAEVSAAAFVWESALEGGAKRKRAATECGSDSDGASNAAAAIKQEAVAAAVEADAAAAADAADADVDADADADENIYCMCKKPPSGDMVACDGEACPTPDEWYHLRCIGLKKTPAMWFCPPCQAALGAKKSAAKR
jgi:hypothetical protein